MHFRRSDDEYMVVKCSGGKAAQVLALMNAVYLSRKLGVNFRIAYFPTSTGTYWDFGLKELMRPQEGIELRESPGISSDGSLQHGSEIPNFPTRIRGISYLKVFRILDRLGVLKIVRCARSEKVIGGSRIRLDQVTKKTRIVSGNFVPLVNEGVFEDLENRLAGQGFCNPFTRSGISDDVVIHYRLGDMRKEVTNDSRTGESRVVDPLVFHEVLESIGFRFNRSRVRVLSDEPLVAQKLLESIGISVEESQRPAEFWSDIHSMSLAKVLIGSLSQMSFLGGCLCVRNGGRVFLPKDVHGDGDLSKDFLIEGFDFLSFRYLARDHWVFSL